MYSHFIGERVMIEAPDSPREAFYERPPVPYFGLFRGEDEIHVFVETGGEPSLEQIRLDSIVDIRKLDIVRYEREVARSLRLEFMGTSPEDTVQDFDISLTIPSGNLGVKVDGVFLDTSVGGREDQITILLRTDMFPECQIKMRTGGIGDQDPLSLDFSLLSDRVEMIRRELIEKVGIFAQLERGCEDNELVDLNRAIGE